MRSEKIKKFIDDRGNLFWYSPSPKSEKVSDDLLVKTILNYGSIDDVKELFSVMGINNVSKIFFDTINKSERRKNNYHELTVNYFTLYFNRYAS